MKLNRIVFYPSILIVILTIIYSLVDNPSFVDVCFRLNEWILLHFGWLFSWSTFLFIVLLVVIYFSPLGKLKIGGEDAVPILTKWRWFAIALCSTIATGILFWGMAEPLYHLNAPPGALDGGSPEANTSFSMSTMFMHWTFTPYSVYAVASIVFAISYYNLKNKFSISSLLTPLLGNKVEKRYGTVLDIICLYALIAGMSASLGAGILSLSGGLETTIGVGKSDFLIAIIGFAIVAFFVVSAASGLHRGIRILSDFNIKAFLVLAAFVFLFGPTLKMIQFGFEGIVEYVVHFIPRSTNIESGLDRAWLNDWTYFYIANWFAWAPVASLFMGRLAVGYTVRQMIHYHLIFPCLFAIMWMTIFSGTSIHYDLISNGEIFSLMNNKGEESVMYYIFEKLPLGKLVSVITLVIIFTSYVTAADSNISAMSAISTDGIKPENPEAPVWIKIAFGVLIGTLTFVMLSAAGVDGIRILSVLGGFPALFIIVASAIGLLKYIHQRDI